MVFSKKLKALAVLMSLLSLGSLFGGCRLKSKTDTENQKEALEQQKEEKQKEEIKDDSKNEEEIAKKEQEKLDKPELLVEDLFLGKPHDTWSNMGKSGSEITLEEAKKYVTEQGLTIAKNTEDTEYGIVSSKTGYGNDKNTLYSRGFVYNDGKNMDGTLLEINNRIDASFLDNLYSRVYNYLYQTYGKPDTENNPGEEREVSWHIYSDSEYPQLFISADMEPGTTTRFSIGFEMNEF